MNVPQTVRAPADSQLRHRESDSSCSWMVSPGYQLAVSAALSAGQSVTLSKCHVSLHPAAHSTNDGRLSLCPSLAGKTP